MTRRCVCLVWLLSSACGAVEDPALLTSAATYDPKAPVAAQPDPKPPSLPESLDTCTPALRITERDPYTGKTITQANLDLDAVLVACPSLRDSIAWLNGSGAVLSYSQWTDAQRSTLRYYYQLYALGMTTLPLDCPTPERNLDPASLAARVAGPLYFSAEQAFALYAASVAHSLALEARGSLGWTLRSFPAAERAAVLSSDRMFVPVKPGTVAMPPGLVAGRDLQLTPARANAMTFVCQPGEAYEFLRGSSTSGIDLVASTADDTLANLTLFVARNLAHGPVMTPDRALATFGFDLPGRLRRRTDLSYGGLLAAPGGCHSAAALLEDLGRAVNIPLENVALLAYTAIDRPFLFRTHRSLAYRWTSSAARYLEHTDDAYAQRVYGLAVIGAGQALAPARRYYDAVWTTAERLRAAGLTLWPELPSVMPGVGYGTGQPLLDSYSTYGRLLGVWTDATPTAASPRESEYVTRIAETMCGTDLVFEYCRNVSTGYGWRNFQYFSTGNLSYLTNPVDAQRAWATTEACVVAAGGCAAATAALRRPAPAETAWTE